MVHGDDMEKSIHCSCAKKHQCGTICLIWKCFQNPLILPPTHPWGQKHPRWVKLAPLYIYVHQIPSNEPNNEWKTWKAIPKFLPYTQAISFHISTSLHLPSTTAQQAHLATRLAKCLATTIKKKETLDTDAGNHWLWKREQTPTNWHLKERLLYADETKHHVPSREMPESLALPRTWHKGTGKERVL